MKKIYALTALTLCTLLSVEAKAGLTAASEIQVKETFHNFSFGPTVFHVASRGKHNTGQSNLAKTLANIELKYEYVRPDTFYFGAVLPICFEKNHTIVRNGIQKTYHNRCADSELRFGYTFVQGEVLLTPFVGYAHNSTMLYHNTAYTHYSDSFLSLGLKAHQKFNENVSFGSDVKVLKNIHSDRHFGDLSGNSYALRDGTWGAEISAAVKFSYCQKKNWEFQAEPFFARPNFATNCNIFGARFLAKVQF